MGIKARPPRDAASAILAGPRVRLRPYRPGDRARFLALFTDPEVMRHVDGPLPWDRAEALFRAHLGRGAPHPRLVRGFAAETRASRAYLGSGSLLRNAEQHCLEIGFLLTVESWGKGYGTEIARLLVEYVHHALGHDRLVATVDIDHAASIRVLARAGLRRVRTVRDPDGDYLLFESLGARGRA